MAYRNSVLRDLFPEQDKFLQALAEIRDDPYQHVFEFPGVASNNNEWAPGRKIEIVGLRVANGAVAQAASTNTTAIGLDTYNNDPTTPAKTHDPADKAAATAIPAHGWISLPVPTDGSQFVEATESLFASRTIAGTQAECALIVDYVYRD